MAFQVHTIFIVHKTGIVKTLCIIAGLFTFPSRRYNDWVGFFCTGWGKTEHPTFSTLTIRLHPYILIINMPGRSNIPRVERVGPPKLLSAVVKEIELDHFYYSILLLMIYFC